MTALRPKPTGLSLDGRVELFAVQWHIQDDTRTLSQIRAEALEDLPRVLARHSRDQLSQPTFKIVDRAGEPFLEALLDTRPWEPGGSTP